MRKKLIVGMALVWVVCLISSRLDARPPQANSASISALNAALDAHPSAAPAETWTFGVAGDSRDCGDVVMPALAAGVRSHHAKFYWHLGDFRKTSNFDEDMQHEPRAKPLSIIEYERTDWDDFLEHQILPFGATPVFLGMGNHELIWPKTRDEYLAEFASWIDTPFLRKQRLEDNPTAFRIQTYYRWTMGEVDFISMDNDTAEQFDRDQMQWFEKVLALDESNPEIKTIVVGMHKALPYSVAPHSMSETPAGVVSGVRAYKDLLYARDHAHKQVYVVASHLHVYMSDVYNTPYWRAHGGVLAGWIVGTAGADRSRLPKDASLARDAMTHVCGYLIGTVTPPRTPEGTVHFKYYKLEESDIPRSVVNAFTPSFVHWCFAKNGFWAQ